MIDACSGAVSRGTCALASTTPESARPGAVALVLWQSPGYLQATVRVGRRNGEWVTRQLAFAEADPDRDRWVTAGLTIATLLDETRVAAPPLPVPSPSAPPAKPAGTDLAPALAHNAGRVKHGNLGLGVGALLGNGWDAGSPMAGAWATLLLTMFQRRYFALAGASFATSNGPGLPEGEQLKSRWLSFELGLGIQGSIAPFRFFAAPEVAFDSVSADLRTGQTLSDHETQLKLRGGAVWEASTHWGLSLGAAARVLPVEAPSPDPNRARRSGLSGELQVGIEFWP